MNITTLVIGAASVVGIARDVYDFKKKEFREANVKNLILTTAAGAATTIAAYSLQQQSLNQIHEKYASSYVESMSDEELERALCKLDLLAASEDATKDVKTL
ncbi:MAG: hypothetical protein J6X28_02370 [Bacilli bacterium]|nr:hypothetical protein [Bacilli bacterium]